MSKKVMPVKPSGKKQKRWVEVVTKDDKAPYTYWWRLRGGNGEIMAHGETTNWKHRARHTAQMVYNDLKAGNDIWNYREVIDSLNWDKELGKK